MSEVKKIIQSKAFREPQFNASEEKIGKLIKGVNQMDIDATLFKIVRILIKFYRFPVLPLFQPLYNKIEKNKTVYLVQCQQDLTKTASFAKAIIKGRSIPSLQFYFKAGCDVAMPDQLLKEEQNPRFINFVMEIDQEINDTSKVQLDDQISYLLEVEERLNNKIQATQLNIQKMCLKHYLSILGKRLAELRKDKELQKVEVQPVGSQRPKASKVKVQVNGKPMEVDDKQAAGDFLCCRSYFYQDQLIDQPQTLVQQYKNYQYPYSAYLSDIIAKTICGFLNGKGGVIYIGISEHIYNKKRLVQGQKYSQSVKQKLLTYFRLLCSRILPDIVKCQNYKVEFVPVKHSRDRQYVAGYYVVRVKVGRGDRNELYSFRKDDKSEYFAFRTENQVLVKSIGQDILQIYRKKIMGGDSESQYLIHPGACRPVELGRPIFEYDDKRNNWDFPWERRNKISYTGKHDRNDRKMSSKEKEMEKVEKYQRGFFLWKKAYNYQFLERQARVLKNGWLMYQPHSLAQFQIFQEVLMVRNIMEKVKMASLLIRIPEDSMDDVERQLDNRKLLYVPVQDGVYRFNSPDEMVQSMLIIQNMGVKFNFEVNHQLYDK